MLLLDLRCSKKSRHCPGSATREEHCSSDEAAKFFGQCKSFADYNYSTDPKTGRGFGSTKSDLKVLEGSWEEL